MVLIYASNDYTNRAKYLIDECKTVPNDFYNERKSVPNMFCTQKLKLCQIRLSW